MTIIDRATKTTEGRILWGALLVVFLLGLLWARSAQRGSVAEQVRSAEGRAIRASDTTVSQEVIEHGDRISFAPQKLASALDANVMTDPTVVSLRVWGTDGALLFSSVAHEPRTTRLSDEPMLASALGGATVSEVQSASPEDALAVFTPLQVGDRSEPVGAVQVNFRYPTLVAAAPKSSTWVRFFFLLALASGAMLVWSLVRGRKTPAMPALTRFTTDGAPPLKSVPSPGAPGDARDAERRDELDVTREQLRQATEAVAFLEGRVKEGTASNAALADVEAAQQRIAQLEAELGQVRAEADQAKEHAASTEQQLDQLRIERDQQVAVMQQRMREVPNGNGAPANGNEVPANADGDGERLVPASIEPPAVEEDAPEPPITQPEPIREVPSFLAELEAQAAGEGGGEGAPRMAQQPEPSGEGTSLALSPEADDLRARLARAATRKNRLGSERPPPDDSY